MHVVKLSGVGPAALVISEQFTIHACTVEFENQ